MAPSTGTSARVGSASELAKFAAGLSIFTALSLIGVKTFAYFASGSVAVLGSLFDSGLDLLSSVIAFSAVRLSAEPADGEHRFGHAKAEAIAGLAQSVIIALSAAFVAREAVSRLIAPQDIAQGGWAMAAMAYSILATAILAAVQTAAIRRSGSLAVEADRAHYIGDLAANLGVLAAIAAASLGWLRADGLAGLGVAGLLGWSALHILRKSLPQLMDQELADRDRAQILKIVHQHAEAKGVHALRTRRAGRDLFIQFHLELDPEMPLIDAHKAAVEIENELRAAFPGADIIIHQDPHGLDEPHDEFGRPEA